MSDANFKFPLGREKEYFPPVIVFDDHDSDKCSPVVYLPRIIIAEEQHLNNELKRCAWAIFLRQLRADYAGAVVPGAEELDNLKELDDGKGNNIVYIPLEEDKGETTLGKTDELDLCRYGKQIVRVYGPNKITVWETAAAWAPSEGTYYPTTIEKEINLGDSEKLIIFHQLPEPAEELEKIYHVDTNDPDPESYEGRFGNMDYKNEESYKQGRFFQQGKERGTYGVVAYSTKFVWAGKSFLRTFVLPGNRAEYGGNQVRRVGRKKHLIREVLRWNGSTEQTIKYWYDDPIVRVLSWTQFVDEEGKVLVYRPNNAPLGKDYAREKIDFAPKPGKTFRSSEKCWGSMWVEYTTTYTEFEIIYDLPNPYRIFEISAGNIERLGYQVFDKKGKLLESGDTLKGNDFVPDKTVPDPEWVRNNKDKISETNLPPNIAVKLFKKIQIVAYRPTAIDFIFTNGRQSAEGSFTPPQPNFTDMPVDELPKVAIFEKRVREKIGGAVIDHVEEITYLDIFGNVTTENLEQRQDAP